jgi:ketosteroid isomerase-like protein
MALSVEDRVEIMQLVARYNQSADARDGETWARTFTEEGVFLKDGGPEARGHAALAKMASGRPPSNQRHWAFNFVIEGDGERATMLADFAALRENRIELTGRYSNDLVKVDGSWKFERRHLVPDPTPK